MIDIKRVQDMTQEEFRAAWDAAGAGELVAANIKKMWTDQEGGYWYAANVGDCDGGDVLIAWYGDEIANDDDTCYIPSLDARI